MKKVIMLLMLLLIMPYWVNAMAVSERFYVGDSVSVGIISDNERVGFHVLKDSGPNEQTVTLIYDGVVAMDTIYDESIPADNHDASVVFDTSAAYKKMMEAINKEGQVWRVEQASILSYSDLNYLGIKKNVSGIYEFTDKFSFLAPVKFEGALSPTQYNYWTSVSDDDDSVYCVTLNENKTSDSNVYASLVSKNITSVTSNEKCAIRPVVVVDKKYIICNNTRPTENVETGINDYLLPLSGIVLVATVAICVVNKKKVFKEI